MPASLAKEDAEGYTETQWEYLKPSEEENVAMSMQESYNPMGRADEVFANYSDGNLDPMDVKKSMEVGRGRHAKSKAYNRIKEEDYNGPIAADCIWVHQQRDGYVRGRIVGARIEEQVLGGRVCGHAGQRGGCDLRVAFEHEQTAAGHDGGCGKRLSAVGLLRREPGGASRGPTAEG
jgi:hypothetical protein